MDTIKEFNVLKLISEIGKRLDGSKLFPELLNELSAPLSELGVYLGISTNQAALFTVIFVLQIKINHIDIREIISFLDISFIDSINLKTDLDALIEKNIILADQDNRRKSKKTDFVRSNFTVDPDITESIYNNQPIIVKTPESVDIYSFVSMVSKLIDDRSNENINTVELYNLVEELEIKNTHINAILKIKNTLPIEDRTIYYEIANDHLRGFPSSMESTIRDIYFTPRKRLLKIRELVEKSNKLFDLDLINLTDAKFANDCNLTLTDNGIEFIFEHDAELFTRSKKIKNVLLSQDITFKEMFYDKELEKQINFLTDSLSTENFDLLQLRLSGLGLSKGVTAILHGYSGCGKTETCYQIAKATNRDVLMVDISQSKSMWFGESEKLVKSIFSRYKRICADSDITPILLINEADALLGTRKENSRSNVAQTENSIQNILLEEMERFEGIMIATTNLAGNLDTAFERRFLFKIKFDKPSIEIKSKIWESKLPWLKNDCITKLATDFSFSGGEIDNIARKTIIHEVLTGIKPDTHDIYSFCQEEKGLSGKIMNSKVGYM